MKKDGWTYKGAGIGSETYCLGVNNSINIVRPTSKTVTTFKGGDLYMTDYNKDIVSYSYNKSGFDICNDLYEKFIKINIFIFFVNTSRLF